MRIKEKIKTKLVFSDWSFCQYLRKNGLIQFEYKSALKNKTWSSDLNWRTNSLINLKYVFQIILLYI